MFKTLNIALNKTKLEKFLKIFFIFKKLNNLNFVEIRIERVWRRSVLKTFGVRRVQLRQETTANSDVCLKPGGYVNALAVDHWGRGLIVNDNSCSAVQNKLALHYIIA
jgi:hypothetical protein